MNFEHSPLRRLCLSLMTRAALMNTNELVSYLHEESNGQEVVVDALFGCFEFYHSAEALSGEIEVKRDRSLLLLKMTELLLQTCPESARYRDSHGANLLHLVCRSSHLPSNLCIGAMQLLLAQHKRGLLEADGDGYLPVQRAAMNSGTEVLQFLLDLCPETTRVVTPRSGSNLLHLVVCSDQTATVAKKVQCLCSRCPAITRQANAHGMLPVHVLMTTKNFKVLPAMYAAGGVEQFQTPVAHPTDVSNMSNGYLPLHSFIMYQLTYFGPLPSTNSKIVCMLRCLLRLYPAGAGIDGGLRAYKKTPYQMAVDRKLPRHIRRLLLRATPTLNPAELHRLNYQERRMAMFVAFKAVTAEQHAPAVLSRLRESQRDLIRHVVSFL